MNNINEYGWDLYYPRSWDRWCLYFLYMDMSNICKNITKDAIINDKGFPNKLVNMTDDEMKILDFWLEWDNPFTNEVLYHSFNCLQLHILNFKTDYQQPKKQIGSYMKFRFCIPEHYFTLDMSPETILSH